MAADFFTFDRDAIEKLVRDHHRLRLQVQNLQAMTARIRRSAWMPGMVWVKLTATLEPGDSAACVFRKWNQDTPGYEDTTQTDIVYDHEFLNFGLDGEFFQAQLFGASGRMELIGSRGLRRHAKPDSTLTAGSSGTVSIWANGVDSTVNVTAYLDWMDRGNDVSSGKEIVVQYYPDHQRWKTDNAECE